MIGVNVLVDQQQTEKAEISVSTFKPYPQYPITDKQFGAVRILVEGYCYSQGYSGENLVNKIFDAYKNGGEQGLEQVAASITTLAGEFAVWIIDAHKIYFFNDALGRLPVYKMQLEQTTFIGRSLSVLFAHVPKVPDDAGILETLWCGYALGKHTLYRRLERIPGGSFIAMHCASGSKSAKQIFNLSLSNRTTHFDKKFVGVLAEKFYEACKDIAHATPLPLHVSLSGGQDSRAVLAGMAKSGRTITSSSFYFKPNDYDAVIAAQVANYFQVHWQGIEIANSNENDAWLIDLKQGLNYSGMAFIGAYLQEVATQHELGAFMLTGDGGDKVLPYLGENAIPASMDELVELLTNRHAIADPKLVATLVGKNLDDLKNQIHAAVSSYSEANLNDRSIRFAIMERGAKAYFEGEDRNRYFNWSTTPFYHFDFFRMAMQVPDTNKRRYKAYAQFMQALNPGLNSIPDAGGGKMGQPIFHIRKHFQEYFRSASPQTKNKLKAMYKLLRPSPKLQHERVIQKMPNQLSFINELALPEYFEKTSTDSQLYLETIVKVFK